MKRVFFGLVPPADLQAELRELAESAITNDPRGEAFRLVAAEEVHVTLLFLGAIPDAEVSVLERAFLARTPGLDAPRLRIHGTGAFPNARRARVLWLGIHEERGSLQGLHDVLVEVAGETSWQPDPRERALPFHAHLTVARARAGRRAALPASFASLAPDRAWNPDSIVLLESRLERHTERYQVLARADLTGFA